MKRSLQSIPFVLFSIVLLFQINHVYGIEELPVVTIDFVSGNIIDLDKNPQMIRAEVQIQNYNPQDGYHFMQIIRSSDGEIIKTTEIFPKFVDDDLFSVQILHYLEPDEDEINLMGEYGMRIFSEFGTSETTSTFSIIKSSMPMPVIQNNTETLETQEISSEELDNSAGLESLQVGNSEESEPKIPIWVHDIFVWYADESISENDLLSAIEYLISEGILNVDSN